MTRDREDSVTMPTSKAQEPGAGLLPEGVWTADPDASDVSFTARGTFGLTNVRGTFKSFSGSLAADASGARGKLVIQAASLNTNNRRRDEHLRSGDFFDVKNYPEIAFELNGVVPQPSGGLALIGALLVKATRLEITPALDVQAIDDDHLRLSTAFDVDRKAIGLGWNRMGIIRGPYHLGAVVTLIRV